MLVDMCHKVLHSKMVAEGIETFDEFNTVKELGIDWGRDTFWQAIFKAAIRSGSCENKIVSYQHAHGEAAFG